MTLAARFLTSVVMLDFSPPSRVSCLTLVSLAAMRLRSRPAVKLASLPATRAPRLVRSRPASIARFSRATMVPALVSVRVRMPAPSRTWMAVVSLVMSPLSAVRLTCLPRISPAMALRMLSWASRLRLFRLRPGHRCRCCRC